MHNDVRTRDKLKEYDAGLAALCKEVFGDGPWRYLKPRDRNPKDRAIFSATIRTTSHDFAGGKRRRALARASSFRRRKETSTSNSKPQSAPAAVTNFLRIALDGGFHSGRFTRSIGGGVWATPSRGGKRNMPKN